jgi:hypothetical protein
MSRNTQFTCSHAEGGVDNITNYENNKDFSLEPSNEAEVRAVEEGKEHIRKAIDDTDHVFGETL